MQEMVGSVDGYEKILILIKGRTIVSTRMLMSNGEIGHVGKVVDVTYFPVSYVCIAKRKRKNFYSRVYLLELFRKSPKFCEKQGNMKEVKTCNWNNGWRFLGIDAGGGFCSHRYGI